MSLTLTLQEQLAGISKEIFRENNNNIDAEHIDSKMSKETKEHRVKTLCGDYVHSNINSKIAMNNEINYNRVFENNEIDLRDIKRGNIVWINLFGSVGSEQGSTEHGRPCVCIQNNMGNTHSPTIIVACITSQINKSRLPIHVEIPASEKYGLTKDSVVLLEQIRTVDKRKRILRKTGHLDESIMKQVDRGLKISIFEPEERTPLEKLPLESKNYIINKIKFIEKAKESIEFYKSINGDMYSINLAEDEKFREENALQSYCDYNQLDFKEIYNNYFDLIERKEKLIAI